MTSPAILALALLGQPDAHDAVEKAIPRIEASLAEYARKRDCFACHHQGVGLLALTSAARRGFKVDKELIRDQTEFTATDLRNAVDAYKRGSGQGGGATRAGYALWALDLGGHPSDATTDAVAGFLLGRERDGWRTTSRRPPSESSPFTATFVALRGADRYASADDRGRLDDRRQKAREWLLATPADDTEARVFRLRALKLAAAAANDIQAAAKDLLDTQNRGGGWPQTDDLAPDAYATSTALVALIQDGGQAADAAECRKGLAFLIQTQQPDGTWHVETRSRPFQTYFESGFPHGKDQFLSMSATCWAVTALCLGPPESP